MKRERPEWQGVVANATKVPRCVPPSRMMVGNVVITTAELREGVLGGNTWVKLFQQNDRVWKDMGGCPLGIGESEKCPATTPFNYFPTQFNAILEVSEETASNTPNVVAERGKNAVIEVAKLPFLTHEETFKRPTLMVFEITGHVMLSVIYPLEGGGRAIHILNPWSLTGEAPLKDVYDLLKTLKRYERNVVVVDVVTELERRFKQQINLQEDERIGFCTLWVGILAAAVIPHLSALKESVANLKEVSGSKQQLNETTLKIYNDIYTKLKTQREKILNQAKSQYGETSCTPTTSAAIAALTLAQLTVPATSGGKRKYRRQTKRKPLFRRRWTSKRRNLQ